MFDMSCVQMNSRAVNAFRNQKAWGRVKSDIGKFWQQKPNCQNYPWGCLRNLTVAHPAEIPKDFLCIITYYKENV